MADNELKELVAQLAINNRQQQERFEEQRKRDQEEDRKRQEYLEELIAEMKQESAKTESCLQKTESCLQKVIQEYGSFINNQGQQAEDFFIKGIRKTGLKVAGIQFDDISPRVIRQGRRGGIELDAVLTNGEVVALLEVKIKLHVNDVEAIYQKRIGAFRKYLREFNDKRLVVLVGGYTINLDALALAHRYGFICLTPDHQNLKIDAGAYRSF